MQERRKLERKYLAVYSRVFDLTSGKVLGYLSDLSLKGAMIISDDPLPEGGDIHLRFDLPDPLIFSVDHLNMDARIAWCKPDIDPAFYNIGFEFKKLEKDDTRIIEEMIETYEFRRDIPNYPEPSIDAVNQFHKMRPTFLTDATLPVRPISDSYWVVPGRLLAGEYPGIPYKQEITRKRLDAFFEADFDTFIDLTCVGETEPYQPVLREQASYYEIDAEYFHFEIGDFGLPTVEQMVIILDALDDALIRGRKIYLHCFGGIGRTGTTVGCYLARHGYSGQAALHQLAQWWQQVPKSTRYPHSPETVQQEQFIRNWLEQER